MFEDEVTDIHPRSDFRWTGHFVSCTDEVFFWCKEWSYVLGAGHHICVNEKKDKEPTFVMPQQHQMVEGGKNKSSPTHLSLFFLLNCASLGGLMDKKQGGRNVCSIQACAARWEHRIKPDFQEGIRNNIFLPYQIKLSVLSNIVVCIRLCQVYCRHECCLSGFELVEGKKKTCGLIQRKKNCESFLNFCSSQLGMIKVLLR